MGKFKKRLDGNAASIESNKPKVSTSLKRRILIREEEAKMKKITDELKIRNSEKLKRLRSRKKRNNKNNNALQFTANQSPDSKKGHNELKTSKKDKKNLNSKVSLRDRMMNRLQGARFRFLNEQMYTEEGSKSNQAFRKDPHSFKAYHEGFQQQVTQWKVNPLDTIIANLKKKSPQLVIADFGCGDARLACSLTNTVHCFDLVALNDKVTACDMAHTPLEDSSVDIAVFCLSLMGTNLNDYILEANRVLKMGGQLKIAEVESRFDDVQKFVSDFKKYGFKLTSKNLASTYFYFMDFRKETTVIKKKGRLPVISLKPCVYKKR